MRISTLLAAFSVALVSDLASAQVPVRSVFFASGFTRPTNMVSPPGDIHRCFVTEQWTGNIKIIKDGIVQATPFLTISGLSTGNEQGLLGLAFHPNFGSNGLFYVNINLSANGGSTLIREYQVSANPDVANAGSARQILQISQPFSNHNGGDLAFGTDGYLYIGMGDGGSGGDPNGNGQNLNALLGKMLRIDVDGDDFPADATKNYAIPPSNPFAGATFGADEIWHYGLRNPWRWSFDRLTGEMYIGDVGQESWEELDYAPPATGGLNYGWRCMEGLHCTGSSGCTCDLTGATLTIPFQEFSSAAPTSNCSLTGGYVYRGNNYPDLQGTYFCADYCSGIIWSMRYAGFGAVSEFTVRTTQLDPPGASTISSIVSFAEDARGELYIIEQGGEIWRIDGPQTGVANCPGDGSIPTQVPCPCTNNGGAGRGCANSSSATGALLSCEGVTDPDTIRLTSSGMPATSYCIFAKTDGFNATGVTYGDGVWCLSGSLIRMRSRTATVGTAFFPEPTDPFNVSTRGATPTGSGLTAQYGVFYRNAASTYCTPATFNATNGYTLTW